MSLFLKKHAVENASSSILGRKRRKSYKKSVDTLNHVCRFEQLEKREYLAADPISVGVVYAEQYQEELGDRFYVAWVGGEEGVTTLDSITINLDKNGNGTLDEGEAFFDTAQGGLGVYSAVPFTVVDQTSDIGYSYDVEDGGMVLKISFTNFHAGDHFIFQIDLDEYQPNSSNGSNNAQVEGGEMGGSVVEGIDGSTVSAVFSSEHYQTETWTGMFVDNFDNEYARSEALTKGYDPSLLPYDVDDGNEGVDQAGVYADLDLKPKPITISGYVYADRDVDCNYDVGEDEPLANVQVTLVDQDGATRTTTTDVNGYYEFADDDLLPGVYQVYSEADVVSPEGWQYFDFCAKGGEYGEKISALQIEVSGMQGGDDATQNNFAKVLESSIEGNVFEDRNDANGKEDGESWDGVAYPATIELWRIDYDSNGEATRTLMQSQTVDSEGHYKFTLDGSWNDAGTLRLLPEKTYEIREIFASDDYSDGTDYVGSLGGQVENDVFSSVFVGYGENGYNYDFGELKLGSIAGNVWEDRNDNGLIDDGEEGIAGVTVELYQWDGASYVKIAETKTDEDGSYQFDDLDINKEYAVKEIQPSEYSDGQDSLGTLGGTLENDYVSNIEIGWDEHGYDYNFGELKLGSISGNVYEDRDSNGIFDENESGISGVTIELYEWDGSDYVKIVETSTAEDGSYAFENLDINKEYAVREKQPTEYSDGQETIGSLGGSVVQNDEIRSIPVQWDDSGVNYNFGEVLLGSIAGHVYEDRDNNGTFDEGESGIADATVELYKLVDGSYVKIAETTTDENGAYRFDNLDINEKYGVKEIQPADYDDGKDSVGTLGGELADNDYVNAVDVQWNDSGEEYNFGELKLGSVSGYVYNDANDNGLKEDGEAPIADVTVELYRLEDGEYVKIAETTTDESGFYKFDSLDIEQTYAVKELQPQNWDDGKDSVGSLGGEVADNDYIDAIRVLWNQHGEEYNFGELAPKGSLSGYVYEDNNNNGVKEDGEAGIENVVVELYVVSDDGSASLVASQRTDSNGYYEFNSLEPGRTYVIRETQPDDYYDGKEAIGTIYGEAVGTLSANDEISEIALPDGGVGIHYDFGELKPASISGYVYEDFNDNGVKESGEAGIAATVVTLQILNEETGNYEDTGRVVTTNSEGHYVFDNLEPERVYRVVETQPSSYRDGKDTVGSLGGEASNDVLYAISVAPGDAGTDYNFGELPRRDIPDASGNVPVVSVPSNLWGASPTSFPYIWYQPVIPGSMTTLYGGGGGGFTEDYSWKLSVINGGDPRFDVDLDGLSVAYGGFKKNDGLDFMQGDADFMNVATSRARSTRNASLFTRGARGEELLRVSGLKSGKVIVGDWDGDGVDDVGVFVNGDWYLLYGDWADGLSAEQLQTLYAKLGGSESDQPVAGDWDGDGKCDIAVFGLQGSEEDEILATEPGLPSDLNDTRTDTTLYVSDEAYKRAKNLPPELKDQEFGIAAYRDVSRANFVNVGATHQTAAQKRRDIIDHVFRYGGKDDVAIAGDWNGDGRTEIGFYRNGSWTLDMNGNGKIDEGDVVGRGPKGSYKPVVGDWNGDGIDGVALFDDSTGEWLFDTNGDFNIDDSDLRVNWRFGRKGDEPVAGDWNGDGRDEVGVYREQGDSGVSSEGGDFEARSNESGSNDVAMRQ